MSGICSAHHPDRGPVEGCAACHSTPADLFGEDVWAAALAEAEVAGLHTCEYCSFEYYLTVSECPLCQNGKRKRYEHTS